MTKRLAVDFHDARGAVAAQHREDFTDPLASDIRRAAAEESGRDGLLSIQEEERLRVAALEMLFHAIGLVGMQERETRLSGDRVPQERPKLLVSDEIDKPIGVGECMPVIGREDDERVARRSRPDCALQRLVEQSGLGRMVGRLRTRNVRDRVDPGPVRVHIPGRVTPRPLLQKVPQPQSPP